MMLHLLFILLFSAVANSAIIGEDNRNQWFEEKSFAVKELGRSTAALIYSKRHYLETTIEGFRFSSSTPTYGSSEALCSSEKFKEEFSPGYCSSFFVGQDRIVTALHCLDIACEETTVLFDYYKKDASDLVNVFNRDSVYYCKKVLATNILEDWAVLQLDRPVTGRTPFHLRASGEPSIGDSMTVFGFPHGIPLKIAADGEVIENENGDEKIYFEALLDIFAGNSGGPVINSKTLEVEGILAVGFGEFNVDTESGTGAMCFSLKHYSKKEDAAGAWVVRSSLFRPTLDALSHP